LISAVVWPLFAFAVLIVLAPQLRDLVSRLTDFEAFGVKAKVSQNLKEAAKAAEKAETPSSGPTPGELHRAFVVEQLTSKTDTSFIRKQVDDLATEYERVRASMPASDTRTRAMEVVVAKMRTIGRAAFPLRYDLSISPSPGRRLQAIVSLQLIPDFDDFLDWLAERVSKEVPFLQYHALVALNAAATDARAVAHLPALERALAVAQVASPSFGRDTGRIRQLDSLRTRVQQLHAATTNALTEAR
jgi:hypothetical protein